MGGPLDEIREHLNDLKGTDVDVLKAILSDPSKPSTQRVAAIFSMVGSSHIATEKKVAILVDLAAGSEPDLRKAALSLLGQFKHPRAFQTLRAYLLSEDTVLQAYALQALCSLGDLEVYHVCCQLISHGNEMQRTIAAKALAKLASHEAESLLDLLLHSKEKPVVRRTAAIFLAQRGNKAGESLLEEELVLTDGFDRLMISCALAKLHNRRGFEALRELLENPSALQVPPSLIRTIIEPFLPQVFQNSDHDWIKLILQWSDDQMEAD